MGDLRQRAGAGAAPTTPTAVRWRRDWTPEEAARREFELLRLLSTNRRVEATAQAHGPFWG
jgi:hypothetical protein